MSHSLPLLFKRFCLRLSLLSMLSFGMFFGSLGCTLANRPEPMLGIVTDSHHQVIAIEPNSPALIAGVHPGDLLLDLTWKSFSNNVRRNRSGIEMAPIPFSDRERIRTLMDFEYILILRVNRANQIVELEIQPNVPIWRKYAEATPTPIPITNYAY